MAILYTFLRPFVYVSLNVYYRIDIKGLQNIPLNEPFVLAPNHSNGFVDPVLLPVYLRPKVRFFARGDVFKGKVAKWVLNQMNASPMYRMQEGYAEIKKNDKSFEECRRLLTSNKPLLIFPEGLCVQQRRVQPLKKGLSRIVFQTLESIDYSKDILVIPVGLNFQEAPRFRSKVFVDVGKPISIKSFEEKYKVDKVRAINEFTKLLEEKMKENAHHINAIENDGLVAEMEEVYTHQLLKDKKLDSSKLENHPIASSEIIDMVNVLDVKKPEVLVHLKGLLHSYTRLLKANNLRDHLLREESINKMNFGTFLLEYFIIYLGMPFYFIGLLLNYPPYYLAKKLADSKVKKNEFYASFRANLSLIFWTIYFIIQLLIVALVYRDWLLLGLFASTVILSGIFTIKFYPVMKKIFGRWRLLRMVRKDKKTVESMVNMRADVMKALADAKQLYLSLTTK
ncbi:MAG: 1-acyl-sn-glycerol-3-phosphate acyltransferase [Bacteroidetes bacterium]|nr:1-acyl-sn-glycerol-3-phosphate acyltransferase [Bacteroidota bacterium]